MKEQLEIKIKGHLKAYNPKTGEVYYDDHNDLTTSAPDILRRLLSTTAILNNIEALITSSSLAIAPITTITYASSPNNGTVTYKAVFDEDSFSDTLDELHLKSSSIGVFSKVTGLSIFKDNTTKIAIEWKLKIII